MPTLDGQVGMVIHDESDVVVLAIGFPPGTTDRVVMDLLPND